MIVKTLILIWGKLKGSKATTAELVGKGWGHEDSRRENDGADERQGMEMEKSDVVWHLYNARLWGWCSSHYLPESDQRPGHICHICHSHTQTKTHWDRQRDRGRQKQTWGEEDGKDVDMPGLSKDVNRTEHKRWEYRHTVEDKIYFKEKMSRWTDAEQRDKAEKPVMRGEITRDEIPPPVFLVSCLVQVLFFILFFLLSPCAVFLSCFSVTMLQVQLLLSLCFMFPHLSV